MSAHTLNESLQPGQPSTRSTTPSNHLGKRKRSQSPAKPLLNGHLPPSPSTDPQIDSLVRQVKAFDLASSIFTHALPHEPTHARALKKPKIENDHDTIESRLANHYYSSHHHLRKDLSHVVSLLTNLTNAGHASHSTSDLAEIEKILSHHQDSPLISPITDDTPSMARPGQVITLRSNDAGVVKQLFTGLRKIPSDNAQLEEIDIRKLPSGFDIADAAVPESVQTTSSEPRTFGQVFRPARTLQPLDQPKSSRGTKDTVLDFIKPYDDPISFNKDDYRLMPLSAGSWLEYAIPDRDRSHPIHSDSPVPPKDSTSLFKAAFSSFAPVRDDSTAVASYTNRSRQWFRKHGGQAMRTIVNILPADEWSTSAYPDIDDDYQDLIDTFVSASDEEPKDIPEIEPDDEKDVLEEISDLLQSLTSYHQLRDLDRNRVFASNTRPSGPEVDIYDLLHQQLKILVSALPPFAVAKLDGDQLKALNINTKLTVTTPDIAGTGQPDEAFLQRARQLQAQQQASIRPVQARNSYTTSTSAVAYNSQARSYNTNAATTPSMPGYAQRGAQMYNTPRPNMVPNAATYNQTPYQQRPQQPYPGATIQQFQRLQNGYAPSNQAPYQPRNPQVPYQSPMPNSVQPYARADSPAKPLLNGTPQPQQAQAYRNSYTATPSTSLLQGPYAQANAHATIQQVKAAHQMQQQQGQQSHSQSPQPQAIQISQQQRQASGTPQPQLQPHSQSQSGISAAAGSVNGTYHQAQQRAQSASTTPVVGAGA